VKPFFIDGFENLLDELLLKEIVVKKSLMFSVAG
jgi:hypothetical protein